MSQNLLRRRSLEIFGTVTFDSITTAVNIISKDGLMGTLVYDRLSIRRCIDTCKVTSASLGRY